jgi:glutamine synthetase
LTANGVWRIDSGVDAICRFTDPKNLKLFSELGVLSATECAARQTVMLNQYIGVVEVEALCLIDIIRQSILPAVKASSLPTSELENAIATLEASLHDIHHTEDEKVKAEKSRSLRLDTMISIRDVCDKVESLVPASLWPIATYKDLLFLDFNQK